MKSFARNFSAGLGLKKESALPFAILRIGIAMVLLVKFIAEARAIGAIYGSHGLLPWTLHEGAMPPYVPTMSRLADLLRPIGLTDDGTVVLVSAWYAVSLIGMLLGWQSRLTTASSWLGHLLLFNSSSISAYGVDNFLNITLFYCLLGPSGAAYSLDARKIVSKPAMSVFGQLVLVTMRVHLGLAYFNAGFEKARGPQWWSGESIWRALMQPQFDLLRFNWLAWVPWFAKMAAWGTIAIELGYIFFIWPKETRRIWVLGAIALHLGIAAGLGLWLFSGTMIIFNLAAFGSELVGEALTRLRRFRFRSLALAG